ncbi:hypothetical protein B9Z65_194 [Elsinoe australis]|uniref:tRNA/rRNA methyltransferase SpoU type domain-containing protein n=1 Tax=Elsinoe australis TaxID=40998 RepID=A0A2P7Z7M2_9PEZI|nr:hypothetical protein B9Z65_194 [Elsinoe australis]
MQNSSDSGLDRLLAHVPNDERRTTLREIASTLDSESDIVLAKWIISKLEGDADATTEEYVLAFLLRLYNDNPEAVSTLCAESDHISKCMLESVAVDLEACLDRLHAINDPVTTTNGEQDDGKITVGVQHEVESNMIDKAVKCLHFLVQILDPKSKAGTNFLDERVQELLFKALSCSRPQIVGNAKHMITRWLSSTTFNEKDPEVLISIRDRTWAWISEKQESRFSLHYPIIFLLWYYGIDFWAANPGEFQSLLSSDTYWTCLQNALVEGDTEVRRSVLLIIRKTVHLASEHNVVVDNGHFQISPQIKAEVKGSFERFCTIFETIVLGRQIASGISTKEMGEENVRKLNALHEQYGKLITGGQPLQTKAQPHWSRIEDMRLDIQSTKSACLKGRGLNHACHALQQMLDLPALQASAEELLEVLEAIWEQIEIQDYPKAALIGLPSIYLHLKCVQRSSANEELQMKLSFFVTEYRKLVAGRIYTWTPLMVALRQAIIAYPDFALVADLESIVKDTVRSPPSPKPEFIMDLAVANQLASFSSETSTLTYEHYYGKNEGVGWAAFFDLLNSIIQLDPELNRNLLEELLQPWMQQRIPPTIVNKWKTTEWVQALLILLQGRSAVEGHDGAKTYTQKIMYLLSVEPLPRYRFLFEWMICLLIQQHEDLMDLVVEVLSSIDHHGNPKYLSSIVRVAVTIVCSKLGTEDAAEKVAQRLTGLAASSKIIIRHEAQWALPTFWRHAQAQDWKTITENSALIGLLDYMHSLERTIVPSAERENSRFNFDTDQTMSTLLCGSYLALEPPGKPQLKLGDYQRLMETEKGSTLKHHQDTKASLPWGTEPRLPAHASYKDLPSEKKQPANEDLIALQTKGTSHLSGTIADIKSKRHNSTLLVVGSLVDNPYNLGGLSRVSEIFGAAALYVASTKVLTHKDFESVAVSSHLHFDVRDLPVADMIDFFTMMRLKGYAIVGIEQTDRSKILGQADTVLPKKTILVLGAEKEGMPATILGECDLLVEIPQRGSTRSMNVQTAASCVLFDYCRQHT